MSLSLLLARHGFLPAVHTSPSTPASAQALGTVLASLAAYGFAPNTAMLTSMRTMGREDLATWWTTTERTIKAITGADRNMEDFVVYKNFPDEVLDKSDAEYWFAQILMYLGAPNDMFTEAALPRPALDDRLDLRVMAEGNGDALLHIRQSLFAQKAGWDEETKADVLSLLEANVIDIVDFDVFGSRENAAWLTASWLMQTRDATILVNTPMDVLRIAAAWSGNDAGLRVPGRLASMPRWLRRAMTTWLSNFSQERLEADFAMRPKAWKPLLHALHTGGIPGALGAATKAMRENTIITFDAQVEKGITERNREVLFLLQERPGVFARRLHQLYGVFGRLAFDVFSTPSVLEKLSNEQLLKLDGYFATISDRTQFLYTPRGQMAKAQVGETKKAAIHAQDLAFIRDTLQTRIGTRLDTLFPEGFDVSETAAHIGLLLNGQESSVGRGTVFEIPESMTFLRTASFWKTGGNYDGNIWFDNGWNFFDKSWESKGGVSWDHNREDHNGKALGVFSGDPTNAKDLEGRACQMIDIYFDRLAKAGVAYGIWSILSFNDVPFGDAHDVLGTLQWGEDATKGKLYEPARAQVVLPLSGSDKAKVVAMLDVEKRQLVFIDANLPMLVRSAMSNVTSLKKRMPALLEAMKATPSAGDLFSLGKKGSIPVTYREDKPVKGKALVFSPTHPDSAIDPLNIADILAMTD